MVTERTVYLLPSSPHKANDSCLILSALSAWVPCGQHFNLCWSVWSPELTIVQNFYSQCINPSIIPTCSNFTNLITPPPEVIQPIYRQLLPTCFLSFDYNLVSFFLICFYLISVPPIHNFYFVTDGNYYLISKHRQQHWLTFLSLSSFSKLTIVTIYLISVKMYRHSHQINNNNC